MNKKYSLLFSLLITLTIANLFLIFYNSNSLTNLSILEEEKIIIVGRIIDGDTFETTDGEIMRLANINAPEKNKPGYEEAKNFLKNFENSSLKIQIIKKEKYGRDLVRAYVNDSFYLNLKMVEKGLVNKFLVSKNEIKKFYDAEEEAIKNSRGLWKKSNSYSCFDISVNHKDEVVHLKSKCGKINVKNWVLKEEGRKEYKFNDITINEIRVHTGKGEDNISDVYWQQTGEIWNDERETVYFFDSERKLVKHISYGY